VDISGVAALAPNNVWGVGYYYGSAGESTLVDHWDGTTWSFVPGDNPSPYGNELYGIAASSANYMWAVGGQYDANINRQTLIERYNDPCGRSAPMPVITPTEGPTPPPK
jgi:hypothetical protein